MRNLILSLMAFMLLGSGAFAFIPKQSIYFVRSREKESAELISTLTNAGLSVLPITYSEPMDGKKATYGLILSKDGDKWNQSFSLQVKDLRSKAIVKIITDRSVAELGKTFLAFLSGDYKAEIVKVVAGKVYLKGGKDIGMSRGIKVLIMKNGEELKDKDGQSLGFEVIEVTSGLVSLVMEKYSIVDLAKQEKAPVIGNMCFAVIVD